MKCFNDTVICWIPLISQLWIDEIALWTCCMEHTFFVAFSWRGIAAEVRRCPIEQPNNSATHSPSSDNSFGRVWRRSMHWGYFHLSLARPRTYSSDEGRKLSQIGENKISASLIYEYVASFKPGCCPFLCVINEMTFQLKCKRLKKTKQSSEALFSQCIPTLEFCSHTLAKENCSLKRKQHSIKPSWCQIL